MSKESYEALQPEIEAIPAAAIKIPNMPIDKFVQEAANLKVWSAEDQPVLLAVGVPQATFDALEPRTGALRHIQSVWLKDHHGQEEARREWNEKSPAASELKDELEHAFRYAFRHRPDLLSKVQVIEKGSGHADLVQDLSDLAVLGNANLPLLTGIAFDTTKLATSSTMSGVLSELLARMNGERADLSNTKILRDKAYTLLKNTMDEIREAGKYAFWKDKQRQKGYKSGHWMGR